MYLLNERDVVALEEDLAEGAALFGCVFLGLRDLDCIVNDKVHKLVESLVLLAGLAATEMAVSYAKLALNADAEVLVEPHRDGGSRLEELEDEVDGRKKDWERISMQGASQRCQS